MTDLYRRLPRFATALAVSLLLIAIGWQKMGSLFGLALASLAGVWLVAWSLKDEDRPWPRPAGDAAPAGQPLAADPAGIGLLASGVALVCAAFALALRDQQLPALGALVGAALCWRPQVDLRPAPGLTRRWLAGLMLLALLAGGAFRFHRLGVVPEGMITVDEPRLMVHAQEVLGGQREVFRTDGFAGNAPFWVDAASMWLFGYDIRGFRMSTILPGFMLIGLIALLALELGGSRLGLLVAGFTAVCVWPVTFSRAEYLVCSSFVPMVAAPWLFLRGLRRGERLSLVLSGFCLGLCFQVYNPSRLIPLFIVLLAVFTWLRRPHWRESLRWSWAPLLGGLLLGLAPLLFWAAKDPGFAYKAYFGNLDMGYMAGQDVVAAHGVGSKMDLALGRVLPGMPRILTMFTTHGGMRPWYFKLDQPVVDQATLFLMLAGMAFCLVRFRQPGYAFSLCWFLLGLTPTLLADPQFHMDERRIMLAMPGALLLAGIGFENLMALGTRGLRRSHADLALLAAALGFFAVLAVNNWGTYFHDIQADRGHQDYDHYNFDNMTRAIFDQDGRSPVTVLSFRKPNDDNWWGANPLNELEEHFSILWRIPRQVACTSSDYFAKGGLFGALRALEGEDKRDPLVVLTPFHFYLEPLLVSSLGGERVADLPPVMATDGPNFTDVGMAWDRDSATRLIRLKGFAPGRLDALAGRCLYPWTDEELVPPASVGRAEDLAKLFIVEPRYVQAMQAYDRNPGAWRAGKASAFSMADPYFWTTAGNLPGNPQFPFRLKARWILRVPADGDYLLGASSTAYLALSVDGRRVYTYLPKERSEHDHARDGYLGQPVALKAGDHVLDVQQVYLSSSGNFNQLVRLMWQRPSGVKETLPLEFLLPAPDKDKAPRV